MREPDWVGATLSVRSPENVEFVYEAAGPGQRLAAWWIDVLITVAVLAGLSIVMGFLSAAVGGLAGALWLVVFNVVWFGYHVVLESLFHGSTPGKRLLRIRAIDRRGYRISAVQAAVRNLMRFLDALPLFYLTAGVTAMTNRLGLRLGDLAAGTVVVRQPRPGNPLEHVPAADRIESMQRDFGLAERVRRTLKTPERDLLGAMAVRRERLEERDRLELFEGAAAFFEERLQTHRPEHVSPERFVLTLAAMAFADDGTRVRRRP